MLIVRSDQDHVSHQVADVCNELARLRILKWGRLRRRGDPGAARIGAICTHQGRLLLLGFRANGVESSPRYDRCGYRESLT